METVKVGCVVKILIDERTEKSITLISKAQYKKIRQGNKNLAVDLVVRSSPMGKAIAGKSIGQTGTMKLPHSSHKIEILGIETSI